MPNNDPDNRKDHAAAPRPSALIDTRVIHCGVAFDFSEDALTEIDAFFRKSGKVIIPLTVQEILEEQIAKKLA